jgi:ethanolamine utilization protein EutP (predicted NTPase)
VQDIATIHQLADEALEREWQKCILVTSLETSDSGRSRYITEVMLQSSLICVACEVDMLFCVQQAEKHAKMILRGAALVNMGVR